MRDGQSKEAGGRSYAFMDMNIKLADEDINAYCLFCRVGYEEKVAQTITMQNTNILALPVLQEKHQSKNGTRTLIKQVMLPGYVFIYANYPIEMKYILCDSKALRFLKDTEGCCELYGENLKYAKWVLRYNGLLECSKAMRLGSRVKIIEGPLKDYEGYIREISKKNRNGRIEMTFMGQTISAWLPFEWVEEGLPSIP